MQIFKDYIVPIFAVIGVSQIWIIAIFKKHVIKPKLDVFESGLIEIGFNESGPTIGLLGTLNAVNKDVFIENIELEIERVKDRSLHKFEWLCFRSNGKEVITELPYSFLVSTKSPHRFNIAFYDSDTFKEVITQEMVSNYVWQNLLAESPSLAHIINQNLTNISPDDEKLMEIGKLIERHRSSTERIDAYAKLNRFFYWESGEYKLRLKVVTKYPNKLFSKEYSFFLAETECERLRLNIINMLDAPIRAALKIQGNVYNITHSKYLKSGKGLTTNGIS